MANQLRQRDMTNRAFDEACTRNEIKRVGFMGYYDIGLGISVSVLNIGINPSNRAKLAYLLKKQEELAKETTR